MLSIHNLIGAQHTLLPTQCVHRLVCKSVDRRGFESVEHIVIAGIGQARDEMLDGLTIRIEHSNDSKNWHTTGDHDLLGTDPVSTRLPAHAAEHSLRQGLWRCGYIGGLRFSRVVLMPSMQVSTVTHVAALALLGHSHTASV